MCRCAHECDVLELRLHGVSAHFCGVWRNRRFLRQCICRYVQSIPLDTGTCSSAWSKGNDHAGRTVQCRRSRHDRRLRAVFLPLRSLLCREVLWPSLLRTAVIPLCYFAVLCILHVSRWGSAGGSVGTVVILCASCPSAASSVLMTASLGMDSVYGSRIISMTSILSVFTIPMLALLTSLILL